MKRFISVCVVILLVAAMAVPALAAEVYVFYPYEPVVMYSDGFDFSGSGKQFFGEFLLPAGYYRVAAIIGGDDFYIPDPIVVSYEREYGDFVADVCYLSVDLVSRSDPAIVLPGSVVICVIPKYDLTVLEILGDANFPDMEVHFEVVQPADYAMGSFGVLGRLISSGLSLMLSNWFTALSFCVGLIGIGAVAMTNLRRH